MAKYEEKSVQFRDDDFRLIQEDIRIMDTKLETKPTTFFKEGRGPKMHQLNFGVCF